MQKANPASVPRSEKIIGRADCPGASSVGDLIYVTATKIGPVYQVDFADPATAMDLPAVAVIIKKPTATTCFIQFHGPVKGVFTGLTPGDTYYLGTDSTIAAVGDANYPTEGGTEFFQQVGVATSSDELLFQPIDPRLGAPDVLTRYVKQALTGVVNGVNTVFTIAIPFIHTDPFEEELYYNGVRLEEGVGCDYVASESGGAGTGFDTVTLAFAPKTGDVLTIDFIPDL